MPIRRLFLLLVCLLNLGTLLLFATALAAVEPNNSLAEPELSLSGPMLGAVEMTEAKIWVQTSREAQVRLVYWPKSHPLEPRFGRIRQSQEDAEFALTIVLDRLMPGTPYRYRIEVDGKLFGPPAGYAFKTQPDWLKRTDPPPLRIALGSCVYLNDPVADPPAPPLGGDYRIFEAIAASQPDLMLWLGDNIYLRPRDYFSPAGISDRYRQLRTLPELQNLWHSSAHYAIWDDHDYGDNDADRSYRLRQASFELFQHYWANPAYGLPEAPGVFGRFGWSDVEFFLTDNRSYRAPFRMADPHRDFFGPRQLQWLKDSLSASQASFKFVVVGNQVLNTRTPSENFYSYQSEYQDFLGWLAQAKIPGVVLLSGDRHHSEMLRLDRPGTYPLYEWTVSPLTSKAYPPFPQEQVLPERMPGSLLVERNYGLIDLSGPAGERVLKLSLHDATGKPKWSHTLHQQDLQPPKLKN